MNGLKILLVVAGLIHVLPVTGFFGATQLNSIYGVRINDPNLLILMQHRAVLFALLGCMLIIAAFKPDLQVFALAAGLISTFAFLWLAWSVGGYNQNLAKVLYADLLAILCLAIAAIIILFRELG